MSENPLAGRRILVVEDDGLVAMLIQDLIQDAGGEIIGPLATVLEASAAVQANAIDLALLDVSLKDGNAYPVANMLDQRAVPFILLSGYGSSSGPSDRPAWRWHSKPFKASELLAEIQALIR